MAEVERGGCDPDSGMETHGKVSVCGRERGGELGAAMVEDEADDIVLSESLALPSSHTACSLLETYIKGRSDETIHNI